MNKLILPTNVAKKIEEIWDWSNSEFNCYSIIFKGVDGSIWCDSVDQIYKLAYLSTEELQGVCDKQ